MSSSSKVIVCTGGHTDRQTDRQTDTQTDRHTDRHTHTQTETTENITYPGGKYSSSHYLTTKAIT